MAKSLGPEKPYTPLDNQLLSSVLAPKLEATGSTEPGEADGAQEQDLGSHRRSNRNAGTQRAKRGKSEQSLSVTSANASVRPMAKTDATAAERMNATLRLKVAVRDKREFEAFTARLAAALDTTLKPSNLLRAMLAVMQNAEPLLNEVARREAPLRRPPNDDAFAYASFEHRLVRMLDSAIRQSTPLPVMRVKS